MIITIQPLKKGHLVHMIDKYVFEYDTLQDVTKTLGTFSDELHKKTGVRPTIKMLPISNTPMAMKSRTYPAKKKAVVKKAKKVVAKGKKK